MSTWEERMAERAQARRDVTLFEEQRAYWRAEGLTEAEIEQRYSPVPPEPGECTGCYEWRPYPPSQAHFGHAWWRICQAGVCDHEHHKDEIWLAG